MPKTIIQNTVRRKALIIGLASAGVACVSHYPLQAFAGARTNINKDLTALVKTLRAMNKAVCSTAADNIESTLDSGSDLYLHLRSAGLSLENAVNLGNALSTLSSTTSAPLRSFSVSYNTQLGDEGAIVLAQSLPNTVQEIGFVGCNIRDQGGLALLQWAKKTPSLRMICVEQNEFASETQWLYGAYKKDNPGVTVIF